MITLNQFKPAIESAVYAQTDWYSAAALGDWGW
mgnify:CR=1 FL=1